MHVAHRSRNHCRSPQRIIVREPQHSPAELLQFDLPQMVSQNNVIAVMNPAIDFDDELQAFAGEVSDVSADRVLPSKLVAVHPAAAKERPDFALRQAHRLALVPGEVMRREEMILRLPCRDGSRRLNQSTLTLSRKDARFALVRSSLLPMGEG